MKPIPKHLLIHGATAIKLSKPDTWNNRTEECTVFLKNVRIEPSNALTVTKDNRQVKLSATLFFDLINSEPTGFDFLDIDIIEALGDRYEVISVDKLYDAKKLHHYEVGLCL